MRLTPALSLLLMVSSAATAQIAHQPPVVSQMPASAVTAAQGKVTTSPAPAALQPIAGPVGKSGFDGYMQAARPRGMGTGGSQLPAQTQFPMVSPTPMVAPQGMPAISTGVELNKDRIEGFNAAIDQVFPMTPDMVRQYRSIFEANQQAVLERPEPVAKSDSGFVSLEPGEQAPTLHVATGIASVLGFYDATGQAWPISQYVIGSADQFQVIQLGDDANNLTITPLIPVGWTNLVIVLKGEPKPVVVRLEISAKTADYRRDIQVMKPGPNAQYNTAAGGGTTGNVVTEAGNTTLLAALTGVDLPKDAIALQVVGVNAKAWMTGETILVRSKNPLLSPSWSNSMSGPDGVRVYEIPKSSAALFSVDGVIIRADIQIP